MSPEQGRIVYDHVRAARPAEVLELGTAHGVGAAYMAAALRDNGAGRLVTVDFAANAESLGARSIRACTPAAVRAALESARTADRTTAIVVPVDIEHRVGGYESWWDVPIAEVSTMDAVQKAREEYVRARRAERHYL